MIQLMKLELKKLKLSTYVKGMLICFLMAACFIGLFLGILNIESEAVNDFGGFTEFILLPDVIIRAIFIIYSSICLNRMVIDEYRNKTILLMFTYPINRKKLFLAKLLMIFLGTTISIFVSTVLLTGFATVILRVMNIYPDATMANYVNNLQLTVLGAFTCGFASLIPFYFGMRKKSMPSTIVSGIILAVLLSQTGGGISFQFDMIRLLVMMGLAIMFVISTIITKLNQLEESDV